MIRAVIWDLGGTLLEYKLPGTDWTQFEQSGTQAAFAHLAGQGYNLPQRQTFVSGVVAEVLARWRRVTGQGGSFGLADVLRDVCAAHDVALSPEQLEELVGQYIRPLSAQSTLLPGARETLQALRARGLKMGLISNTMWPGRYHLADLARHGLAKYLDHTLFSADVGVWKPHAAIFHRSLGALCVAPDEAVFVGDFAPHDVVGAQNVGMKGVHITGLNITPGESSADGATPDGRIRALAELPLLIAQWEGDYGSSAGIGENKGTSG